MRGNARVLIVDPDRLSRSGLSGLLKEQGFEIAAEVGDVVELPATTAFGESVAVALIDMSVLADPVQDTLETLQHLLPGVRVVTLGRRLDVNLVKRCFRAGAAGYLLKSSEADVLTAAIVMVVNGERVYPSELIGEIFKGRTNIPSELNSELCSEFDLSEREQQILTALVCGESNKTIAKTLRITEATVKAHLQGLMQKINAENRTQAAVWAVEKMRL